MEMIDPRKSLRTFWKDRSGRHKLKYLERAFLRTKNLKSKASRGGTCGEEGAPLHLEAFLALSSSWGGDLGFWALERGRALEGERAREGGRGRE